MGKDSNAPRGSKNRIAKEWGGSHKVNGGGKKYDASCGLFLFLALITAGGFTTSVWQLVTD